MRVWMDGVKEAVTNRGLTLYLARVTVHDGAEWRGLVVCNGTCGNLLEQSL